MAFGNTIVAAILGGPSTPKDSDNSANSVAEGAAANTTVGVTASSTSLTSSTVTYSLAADSSGGGFKIDPVTGVVTVADPSKIDFETAAGHAYSITTSASDGFTSSTQTFTIAVTDVAPSTPVDSNAAANSVAEGAANGTAVGVTASSTDINGPAVTYSLVGDTSGGGFTINAATGVISVADGTKIDYESAPGHAYTVTAQASDGTLTSSQTFTIGVADVPISTPVDANAAANSVAEGAANGSTVGVTASAIDPNGPATTYALIGDSSGGGFTINAATGVVTVADNTKIDYETAAGHAYTVTVQATNGGTTTSQTFTVAVTDVAPSTPVDSNGAANSVSEGAANGSLVGVTASSTDVNGPSVTYALIGDSSGGGFTINAATGVVIVADNTKIDYETAPGHAYTVTAQASDGTLASSQTFTIGVTDVAPSIPVDSNAAANAVVEGAANGTAVGITASSTDVNGPAVTYSLVGDTSGGGFTINATTGVVTVADGSMIDYETAPGHAYTITAQASDGTLSSSQTFTIGVLDVAPSTPVDGNAAANTVAEGAANGSQVGVTASSTDVNGPAVSYSLVGDTSGGGFTINAATGAVIVADSTKLDFETSGGSYTVVAQSSDGTLTSSQAFVIAVTDVAPSTPVDSDGAANQVSINAPAGTYAGVTASSTDVNGPAVTYSLVGDTSGGGFTINAATGQVTVADSSKVIFVTDPTPYNITVDSSDGTLHSQQTFTINVIPNTPPVANDDTVSATEAGGLNNAIAGSNPSGNVVLGTGSAGNVQDTDVQDPSTALTVVAVHTGAEGASVLAGTVNSPLIGDHGTLTLNSTGAYTYAVNQTDAQVQALATSAETLTDTFNYTIQDTGGLQDTATLTVTIHGADDLPQAVADTATMTEDTAPTAFNVIANDTQDPDHTASNAITFGPAGITVTGPAGETFADTDATATIVSNQVQVSLVNAHFQQLALGEHATVTVPYTLTGDAGETSAANLVVTVNGANDVPVAVDDTPAAITEDQVGTFTVLGNDTLDADHGAPNNVTTGAITNLVAPSGESIDASDVSLSVNGSNQVVVTLGADFQHMQTGQTTTFDVAYTLHGDQAGDTSTATLHVTVNGVSDAPDLTPNSPSAVSYTENAAATALLAGGSVTDADGTDVGGSYTIAITNNASAGDQIVLLASSPFAVNGSSLLLAGDTIGTVSGLGTSSVSVTSLTAFATPAALSQLAKAFGYQNSTDDPATAARTVTFTFSDGALSDTVTQTVNVTAVNDAPVNTVPAALQNVTENSTLAIAGLSISDVDSEGASETVTLGVAHGHVSASGGGATVTNNNSATVTLTGTVAQINATLAAGNIVYQPTSGYVGADTLTMTTNDGGHSPSGALQDIDKVSLFVNLANPAALDGQLWYTTILGLEPPGLRGHINSDGSDPTPGPSFATGVTGQFVVDIAVDSAAGYYFVVDAATGPSFGTASTDPTASGLIAYRISDNSEVGSVSIGDTADQDEVQALAVDTVNHFIYVAQWGVDLNHSGIEKISYDPTTGALGPAGTFVVNGATTPANAATAVNDVRYMSLDVPNHLIYYTINANGYDTSPYTADNAIFVADLNTGVATQLSSSTQFPAGSQQGDVNDPNRFDNVDPNGYLGALAVDSADGIVYFLTHSIHPGTNNPQDALWYINTTGTNQTAVKVTGVTIAFAGENGGLSFDPQTRTLYISDQDQSASNSGSIIAAKLSADGHSIVSTTSFDMSTLTGVSGLDSSNNPIPDQYNAAAGTTFLNLPVATISGTATHAVEQGAAITLLNAPTITDRDSGYLSGATVQIVGGTFSSNEASSSDDHLVVNDGTAGGRSSGTVNGTSITVSYNSASETLTLSGYDTLAHYQTALSEIQYFTTGDNPTNYGSDTTRTIHWTVSDGQPNIPFGAQNSGTTTITINATNDAPSLDLDANNSSGATGSNYAVNYTSHSAFVAIADGDTTIADPDNTTLASATVTLTDAKASDVLAIAGALPTGISATITPGAGIITVSLSGAASAASYQAALHQIVFANNSDTPDTSDRIFNVTVSDGTTTSATATSTIHVSAPLLAEDGGIASAAHTPGEMQLTQTELDSVVAAAIDQWAAAGASASQLAALHATTFSIGDLSGNVIGDESSPAHITIDTDAAGHGWFVDPTPSDNFEFTHAVNSFATDLFTDPTSAAAGHLDLLTTVTHEMGHVLGLPDETDSSNASDLMYINLADGERRLPDAADVTQANAATSQNSSGQTPAAPAAQAPASAPTVVHTDGGGINFVFEPGAQTNAATPPPLTHIAYYNGGQGFTFDFSALTSQLHTSNVNDASLVRAVEDPSGNFATLQLYTDSSAAHWVSVAQLEGAHTGDTVNVLIDSHAAIHLAQVHTGALV